MARGWCSCAFFSGPEFHAAGQVVCEGLSHTGATRASIRTVFATGSGVLAPMALNHNLAASPSFLTPFLLIRRTSSPPNSTPPFGKQNIFEEIAWANSSSKALKTKGEAKSHLQARKVLARPTTWCLSPCTTKDGQRQERSGMAPRVLAVLGPCPRSAREGEGWGQGWGVGEMSF